MVLPHLSKALLLLSLSFTPWLWAEPLTIEAIEEAFARNDQDTMRALIDAQPDELADFGQRYLLVHAYYRLGAALLQSGDKKSAKSAVNPGIKLARDLVDEQPDSAEPYVLLGSLYGLKASMQAIATLRLGPKALRMFDRALDREPDNPRARMIKGVATYQTPAIFGGGRDKGAKLMIDTIPLFVNEPEETPAYLRWGAVDLYNWLGRYEQSQGNEAKAQAYFAEGLKLSPDDFWILEAAAGQGYQFYKGGGN